ncbi:MAG TPA: amidohydrolase family protein [Chitinophagaceae bacterium]|nr:amidohydrolase family protein [Chitinophagaceae bacterium]
MRYFPVLLLIMVLFSAPALCQTYITHVNLLDVEKMKMLPDQTVVFEKDKITQAGPSKRINVPAGAQVINGTGKYLMPGLVDAHVHFFQSGGLYTRPDAIDLRKYRPYEKEIEWAHQNMEDFLRRYAQSGITSVVDVGSTVNFLKQRDSFRTKTYAPAVYMTGPLLTTWEPAVFKNLQNDEPFSEMKTEEDARKYVQQQLPFKPDFIKIWYIVLDQNTEAGARKLLPLVQAVIDESHKNNLRVAVHATERITAQLAVESGCDFLVHGIDDEIVKDDFVQLLKKKNVVLCPTLVVADNYGEVFSQRYELSYLDYTKANATTLSSLFDLRHLPDTTLINRYKTFMINRTAAQQKTDSILRANTKKLVDAGVIIATGTDAGNIGTLHASSYWEELQAMRETGFSMWQLLQASTINGAKAAGKEKEFGSIQAGKRADLLLLNANPLDSIANWRKIAAVINKGVQLQHDSLIAETPLALVQRQVNAYNGHDLEAFLEPYAEDVEIYQFPNTLQIKGKEAMRKTYQFITQTPTLQCEIQSRIVQGNVVIDHERVRFGNQYGTAVAVYHIEGGKIKKVYFIY